VKRPFFNDGERPATIIFSGHKERRRRETLQQEHEREAKGKKIASSKSALKEGIKEKPRARPQNLKKREGKKKGRQLLRRRTEKGKSGESLSYEDERGGQSLEYSRRFIC